MKKSVRIKVLALCMSVTILSALAAACQSNASTSSAASAAETSSAASQAASSAVSSAANAIPTTFPRNQTLYWGMGQWGSVASFNPFSPTSNNSGFNNGGGLARELVYETLFMFNPLDGKLYPLLGSSYTWSGQTLTVKMNPAAKWDDGQPLTAADVAYTFSLMKTYTGANVSADWSYLQSVTATDSETVQFVGNPDLFNQLMMEQIISSVYIVPQHIWSTIAAAAGSDSAKFVGALSASDPNAMSQAIGSGPYKFAASDATKVVFQRVDTYWGQDSSMFGKLPAPAWIVANIYKDNDSMLTAFKAGQIDVNQQFAPQIWTTWENDKLPISTYLPDAPYYMPGSIPSAIINCTEPGLNDSVVRKALAMAIDYKTIATNAMSGYTAAMVPSLMLPTDPQQALIDETQLKPLQWTGNQAAEANTLLQNAGWVKGSDGVRAKNGVKLAFTVSCPTGWTDWMAAAQVVAQSGNAIGMKLTTSFPDAATWSNNLSLGKFDIYINSFQGGGIADPWAGARSVMSSVGNAPIGQATTFNWGRYKNPAADALLAKIPNESNDPAQLKADWTALNKIYLTDVPVIGLMYRPVLFYTVNASVWTGFPKQNDGTNIPPTMLSDGYGIKGLYVIGAK